MEQSMRCDQLSVVYKNGDGTFTLNDGNGGIITFKGAGETTTTLIDNNDGTFSYLNENNDMVNINKALLTNNADGTFSFDNGSGSIINFIGTDNQDANQVNLNVPLDVDGDGNFENTVQEAITGLSGASSDNQNLSTDGASGNISIDNGNTISINIDDADADATNELSDLSLTGNTLTLTNAEAGATGVDLSGFVSTDDQKIDVFSLTGTTIAVSAEDDGEADKTIDLGATFATDAEVATAITASEVLDLDKDATNELSDLSLTGNTLTLTNAEAGATGVDLSGFVSTDDQKIDVFSLTGTTIAVSAEDDERLTKTIDLGATFATDAEVATAITASEVLDLDKDATNELSDLSLTGNTLTLTNAEAGATGVDLSGFVSTDDQKIDVFSLTGTTIAVSAEDDGEADKTIDLGATFATDAEVATAITASEVLDLDKDATNELSDLSLTGNTLTLTNAEAGATGVDLSGFVSTDDQKIDVFSLTGTTIAVSAEDDGEADKTIDLGATFATDAEVATAITASEVLDLDKDATNELSDLSLTGNTLTLTNAEAGATGVDLSGFVSTDDQKIDVFSLTGTTIAVSAEDDGEADKTIDLGATFATDAEVATAITASEVLDLDKDATNELSDLSLTGNTLTLTNAEAGATGVDLSGFVSTDDQKIDVFSLTGTTIAVSAEDDGEADKTIDLGATFATDAEVATAITASEVLDLDKDATNELSDLDLTGNTLTLTMQKQGQRVLIYQDSFLPDDQKIDVFSLTGTTIAVSAEDDGEADKTIDLGATFATDAEVATAITASEVLDLDKDATNELSDLSLTGNTLTLTNAEAGATGVDLSGFVSTDDQKIDVFSLTGTTIAVSAEDDGEADKTIDLGATFATDAEVATAITASEVLDLDKDATNELSDLSLTGNTLTLTNAEAGATGVDLSGFVSTDDQKIDVFSLTGTTIAVSAEDDGEADKTIDLGATFATDAEVATAITASEVLDLDKDATNELSDLDLTGNTLTLTNAEAGATGVDLSGFVSTDDQKIDVFSLTGTTIAVSAEDDGEADKTIDLGATFATDAEVATAITASEVLDLDKDATNELSDLDLTGNTLTLTNAEAGATGVDLSGFVSTDDQKIDVFSLTGTTIAVSAEDDGEADKTIDLGATFATDAEVATAITASEVLDLDKDATNELSDLDLTGNTLTLTNAEAGATGVDLSGFVSTDDQKIDVFSLTGTTIAVSAEDDGEADKTIDLGATFATDAEVATAITASEVLDLDKDATNELSDLDLTGNTLTLTNAEAGATGVDLSGFVSTDDQKIDVFSLTGTTIAVSAEDDGEADKTIDLGATFATDAEVATAITASEVLDLDKDATNELSDLDLTGNTLTLTNAEAGATGVDLSGFVSTDDQKIDVFSLTGTTIAVSAEDDGEADKTIDLGATFATDAEVATAITASEALDLDKDATNELSDLSLTGNTLTLTNAEAGATGVDLSGFVSTDDQKIDVFSLTGTTIAVSAEDDGEADKTIDLGATFATDAEVATAITASEVLDLDKVIGNETVTGMTFDGTTLTLSEGGNTDKTVDLSSASTDDQKIDVFSLTGTTIAVSAEDDGEADKTIDLGATFATDAEVATAITASEVLDLDKDATNELSDLSLTGNTLTLTNAEAGATGVDLSGFVSTDDQKIDVFSLTGTTIAVSAEDDGEADKTIDLGATFATDAEVATAITASEVLDLDKVIGNETVTGMTFDGTTLTLSEGGNTDKTVDLSSASTDDQKIDVFSLTGTTIAVSAEDDGEADKTIDLGATFATDAEVATAITASEVLDLDKDATNELSDLSLTGNTLTLTNAEAGATGVDLSGFVSTDDQKIDVFSLTGTTIAVSAEDDGEADKTIDLGATFATDAEVATAITASEALDLDKDATNELSDLSLTGNTLTLTNAEAGATGVDLSGFVSTDDQKIDVFSLTGTTIAVSAEDDGEADKTIDLGATFATDAEVATAITASEVLDLDKDATNELSDLSLTGNTLTLTNAEAGATGVDLSGFVSTDDQKIDVFSLTGTTIAVSAEDDGEADKTIDLGATFATDAEVATAITASEVLDLDKVIGNETVTGMTFDGTTLTLSEGGNTDKTVDLSSASTDDQKIDVFSLTGTTIAVSAEDDGEADKTIDLGATFATDAEVATAITASEVLDLDKDATNELSDLDLTGNTLTLTNAEAGATGVDLSGFVSTDDQKIDVFSLTGTTIAVSAEDDGEADKTIDLGATFATDAEVATAITASEVLDLDKVIGNETVTGMTFDGTTLTLSEGGNTDKTVDLSSASTDDQKIDVFSLTGTTIAVSAEDDGEADKTIDLGATFATDAEVATAITASEVLDLDKDATNELSDLSLTGNTLTLTNAEAGATGVDLSGFVSTDDQKIDVFSLTGTTIAVSAEDDGEADKTIDLGATFATDAEVATAITASEVLDLDKDATNELSDLSLTGNTLTLTNAEAGATGVDLSGFVSTDDQKIDVFSLTGTTIAVSAEDDGEADKTIDLGATFATDAEVATAITASEVLDLDKDATNELSDLDLTGNTLTLTNAEAGATGVDLSGFVSTDDQKIDVFSLTGTTIAVSAEDDGEADKTIDLGATFATDAEVATAITASEVLDLDKDATNELSDLDLTGNTLTLTNPATGSNSVTLPSDTVTSLAQNTTTGVITYTNESSATQTANVVATETNNDISIGANGGAFYASPIKAFGKIASAGTVTRATTGVTSSKLSKGRYRVTLPTGSVSDTNYIIQLTQPGRGGAGNDDPGISYSNQTATSFDVIIGDNDNGGTDRSRFDSDFMFVVLDL